MVLIAEAQQLKAMLMLKGKFRLQLPSTGCTCACGMIDGGLVREGFGSYVEAEVNRHGELVAVHSRQTVTGEIKVVTPQMLIGYLLEMASGSKDTPKGGHAGDLLARAGQEVVTACGPRSKMKFKKGAYGSGLCADEP